MGDLRIVAEYATREEQPDHERIYFVRVFASHLREISKLLVLNYRDREDVRQFVAALPREAQDARDEAERIMNGSYALRPDAVLWKDMKRVRDDTFHYASDVESQERLRGGDRRGHGGRLCPPLAPRDCADAALPAPARSFC